MKTAFKDIFPQKKPIIGMIHLAGDKEERLSRALSELDIYAEEGLAGAIIEDFHGDIIDIDNVFRCAYKSSKIPLGVNVLSNPYLGFAFAKRYCAKFVQFDSVQTQHLSVERYSRLREENPEVVVLGGVRFKGQQPTGMNLEEDIADGMKWCDAIVTTSHGTGIETPISKLMSFRMIMGDEFPLIDGSGFNPGNAYEHLSVANGAIVGSYFKNGNTKGLVDKQCVRDVTNVVKRFNT